MAKVRDGNKRLQVSINAEVYDAFSDQVSERKKGPVIEQLLREKYGPNEQ